MKLVIDIPKTMIDELRDGCFGFKHNAYELAGIIMNGVAEPKADALGRIRAEILDTLYVDSLIFGELIDFKNGKISADDVIEEFNRVARIEVLKIIGKYI